MPQQCHACQSSAEPHCAPLRVPNAAQLSSPWSPLFCLSCNAALQGLEDPQLIFQAVPEALSGRRFAPPSTGMRVHFLPRRARFAVTSSFVSGTSGSGDSGNSGSGRMLPLKLRHLLNMHSHSITVSCNALENFQHSGIFIRQTDPEDESDSQVALSRTYPGFCKSPSWSKATQKHAACLHIDVSLLLLVDEVQLISIRFPYMSEHCSDQVVVCCRNLGISTGRLEPDPR